MWPEYREKSFEYKQLTFFDGQVIYDSSGERIHRVQDFDEVVDLAIQLSTICFVDSLVSSECLGLCVTAATRDDCSVLCDSGGKPIAIRIKKKSMTSWFVQFSSWFDASEYQGPFESLKILEKVYKHIGVGTAPTPSSLGRKTMRYVYQTQQLKRHTCMPLSCETFLRENGYGGITVTKQSAIGKTYSKTSEIDSSMNYVSRVLIGKLPDETPICFSNLDNTHYETWFAQVKITLRKDLPLGVFPVRKNDRRVVYPTKKGVYYTHLWKETVDIARENYCDVEVSEGWGWKAMTEDNRLWALWIFNKRVTAPNKEVERKVKKVAVACLGSFGRSRDTYELRNCETMEQSDVLPVLLGNIPLDLWVSPARDERSALMAHWHRYLVSDANNAVRSFALPYAEEGKLLLIDTDGIFVRGEEAGRKFIEKHSMESIGVPPGTWLWRLHHHFKLLRNRMWVSDEEPNRYGKLLERIAI